MAKNNRTEAKSQVTAAIVPTVTNAIHKTLLNDELLESLVFRKDVPGSTTTSSSSTVLFFTDTDTIALSVNQNILITFAGLENGDVKYFSVTKSNNHTVSFGGATDVSPRRELINTNTSFVMYQVINKSNILYVRAVSIDYDPVSLRATTGSFSPADDGYALHYVTPALYQSQFESNMLVNAVLRTSAVTVDPTYWSLIETELIQYYDQKRVAIRFSVQRVAFSATEPICRIPSIYFAPPATAYLNGTILQGGDADTGFPISMKLSTTRYIYESTAYPATPQVGDIVHCNTIIYIG